MKKIKVFGEYSPYGYTIYSSDGRELYRAGNSRFDSADVLPLGHRGALDLETIKMFCEQTGLEIAEELGAQWLGCQPDESYDDFQ